MHFTVPTLRNTLHSSHQRNLRSAKHGQSITEYAIIGALIIMVSIGALTLLGGNLQGVLGTLSSKVDDPSLVSVKPNLLSAPPVSGPGVLNSSPLPTATALPTSVQTSAQPLQTAGVNGETEKYSQEILKTAQQALANGKIDQAQYDILLQMANQGHEMATMEGLLGKSYQQNNGTQADFYGTFITYNGQRYTPAVLSQMLDQASNSLARLQTQLTSANSEQASVLNTVTSATAQINSIAMAHTGALSSADTASIAQLLGSNSSATDTNQQAATICTAGQHLDVNNHCVN